jgi:predicted nucleotidyltransferase
MDIINPTWTRDRLLDVLYQHRHQLQAMGITKIGIFGSYVRNEQKPTSDVDLLFTMNPFTWRNWMDSWNFLEATLGVSVDLIPEEDLRPELRPYILSEVRYVADF